MKTKWLSLLFMSLSSIILPMEESEHQVIEPLKTHEEKALEDLGLPNEMWAKILLYLYGLHFDPKILDDAKDIYEAIKIIEKHIKKCCFSIPLVCKRFKDLNIPKEIRKLYIPYLNEKFLEKRKDEEGLYPKNSEWDNCKSINDKIAQFIITKVLSDIQLLSIILANPNLNLLNLLLFYGIDVNKKGQYSGKTLMHHFGGFPGNKKNFFRLLFNYNADPNIQDRWGNTPLSIGLSHYNIDEEIIELLLKYGTNPNAQNAEGELLYL